MSISPHLIKCNSLPPKQCIDSTAFITDYGVPYTELENIKKGPKFELQPEDLTVITRSTFVTIETIAIGNPQPGYTWKRFRGSNTTINSLENAETVGPRQKTFLFITKGDLLRFERISQISTK